MALIKEIEKDTNENTADLEQHEFEMQRSTNVGSFSINTYPSTNPIGRISIRLLEEK